MQDTAPITVNDIYNKYEDKGFVLDLSKLQDGDIIIEHGYSKFSPIIQVATDCYYTHAMIYLETTIIEATGDGGVFSRIPNRFYVPLIEDLKVLRLIEPAHPHIIEKIKMRARDLVGSSYSVKEAALAGLTQKAKALLLKKINKYQFCSRLVAQCYEFGGIPLVKNTNYCSPKDIFKSELLYEVIDAIKEATPEELHHARSGVLHPKHLRCCVEWVKEAKKILKKWNYEVQTINEIIGAVINSKNKKIDNAICDAIHKSGYLTNYLDDKNANPFRYDVALFSKKTQNHPEIIDAEIYKEISITKLHMRNYYEAVKQYKNNEANILKLHIELQKNLLLIIKERLSVIVECCHKNHIKPNNIELAHHMINDIENTLS